MFVGIATKTRRMEVWPDLFHACGLCVSVWAVCSPSQAQVLLRFGSAVWTLSRISSLNIYCPERADTQLPVHTTPPPKDSLIGVVDHTCQLHLHIQVCFNCSLSKLLSYGNPQLPILQLMLMDEKILSATLLLFI